MIDGRRNVRPIRWALVGGGAGSAIGYIHRCAATRDGYFQLVSGAFDVIPEQSKQFGKELGLDPARCYGTYKEMFELESQRSDGIEAVTIATPNNLHFEICKAALESNLHVICEKPLCLSSREAQYLRKLARERERVVGVMFGYAGHQMVEQARQMVCNGEIGDVRIIKAEFAHGGCSQASPQEKLQWRFNPNVAGPSFVLADLGVHPLYLMRVMVPDLKIEKVSCIRQSIVQSRAPLEDNAFVTMESNDGAIAFMWVSAVNTGSQHGLRIRIVGSEASVEWCAEEPNKLRYEPARGFPIILQRGTHGLYPSARAEDRIAEGHSEGLFEAWANLYRRFASAIRGETRTMDEPSWYPDIDDGAEAVLWVERCIESSERNGGWVNMY
ncbi:Gfo/Idh/MocA family oxidoreductase [Alicyclobacillus mali]|uniref:Gfo/Idh/MocA family oxidoreductase n=1 Tax=Alicyclobacillus mali (ex Roth et al. 2021) TaxID=1123961 RepID=A0ABS0EYC5_9BACL|nr:Gfo/Idh/MocA family oxidoreductase [Alicyclobacillus mali (ex Roth et al. 2021)]MBF8376297.1 Gfo/Idh/MocA family oxidoreductase [Alicyclobacillus mali (ex Roth et al. 2021)]